VPTAASELRPSRDALSRFLFERDAVRGAFASLDDACRDILACHPYPPPLRRVMAELLAASTLLASTLKFDGRLVVQLRGDGPVRLLVVECGAALALRATAQWDHGAEALPADADLATLAGGRDRARLAITLDPGDGGPLYQGIVGLEAASVAALLEHYLAASEQIDSRLLLDAQGDRVRGLLLQRMPEASEANDRTWQRIASAAAALAPRALFAAHGFADLVAAAFPEHDIRVFEPRPVRFACSCSAERIGNALRLLGRAEIDAILAEQGQVGVTCEFCNRRYTLLTPQVRALFAGAAPTDAQRPAARPDEAPH
jgi:molecular chaperone Hsp33